MQYVQLTQQRYSMPAVTINSLTFNGTVFDLESVRRAPDPAGIIAVPTVNILVGRDGTRNKMYYGNKYKFVYEWKKVPQTTRDALWAIRALTGTFPLIHIDVVTYTVQIEEESDYDEVVDHTIPGQGRYYNIKLVMHQP